MFEWFDGNQYLLNATIYENNITLNSIALDYLKNEDYCILGLNSKEKKLAIKATNLDEVQLKLVKMEQLNKISKGKSYIRISNKNFIESVSSLFGKKFSGEKFKAYFDEAERILVIDLNYQI